MKKYILLLIFILWSLLHIWFFGINQVLKNADSFAYLQMSSDFLKLNISWFWTGWFGFIYSAFIALFNLFIPNDMTAWFVLNIVCFNIIAFLCYLLWRNYLKEKYIYLFLTLIFLSPILLNFNISILSENIYIPLFLILFLSVLNFRFSPTFQSSLFLWFIIALLYLTRSEAFIYIWSIWLIFIYLWLSKVTTFKTFLLNSITLIISFFVFISPYLYYMHTITWEWWLTNKWSSNLRQAELRWLSKMDDDWFERAVWELTPDHHHLIAWFAWWLKYDKPLESKSLKNYILKDPKKVIYRQFENQKKLFSSNLVHLIVWDAKELYSLPWSSLFYKNIFYLAIIFIPIILMIWWIISLLREKDYYFVFSFFAFFLTASFFFTIFFVLDRYFVIFVPLFIFFIVYWLESINFENNFLEISKDLSIWWLIVCLYLLWLFSYYNTNKNMDEYYKVKQIAWEWLKEYTFGRESLKVMERFPIVTYYSNSKVRWLTPYTDNIKSLVEYAKYNEIEYLVVDSLDFKKYRPDLKILLDKSYINWPWLNKIKEFNYNGQKVILYRIEE